MGKKYSAEEKANILRLCKEIGIKKVQEQTGIAQNTVYRLRKEAQQTQKAPDAQKTKNIKAVKGVKAAKGVKNAKGAKDAKGVKEKPRAAEGQAAANTANSKKRNRYTAAEKDKALRLYEKVGMAKASEQTGIGMSTIFRWRANSNNTSKSSRQAHKVAAIMKPSVFPASSVHSSHSSHSDPSAKKIADKGANGASSVYGATGKDESIRLRTENHMLRERVSTLQNALRAFAQ